MQDTKYHVGDVVIVRQDLDFRKCYWMRSGGKENAPWRNVVSDVVTEDMIELCGQTIEIEEIVDTVDGKKYRARGRYWTDDMFSDQIGNECYCESLL
nr:MAG TPA: hypothetical protein [Caudoviricetes sp.]